MKTKIAAVVLAVELAIAAVSYGRDHKKHLASDYTHTAAFATYLWTAGPGNRGKVVHYPRTPEPNCETWDDGYQSEVICNNNGFQQSTTHVDTKMLVYASIDGAKPVLVDGPRRGGTTPCRLVPDPERHGTDVFVPLTNKKGKISGEVEYKTAE